MHSDWKSRISLLELPIDPANLGAMRTAIRLLGGTEECAKFSPSYPAIELASEINKALSGAGFTPLSTIARGVSVFPHKELSNNFWKTTLPQTTYFRISDPYIRNLPRDARTIILPGLTSMSVSDGDCRKFATVATSFERSESGKVIATLRIDLFAHPNSWTSRSRRRRVRT